MKHLSMFRAQNVVSNVPRSGLEHLGYLQLKRTVQNTHTTCAASTDDTKRMHLCVCVIIVL